MILTLSSLQLPYNVGWQDLKDLFRQAAVTGSVIRADVHMAPDGRPKGSGIVAFDTPDDARNAINQFNGYEWQGRNLEVREDRFAGAPGGGGFGRGGFGGGRGGFGGFQGGRGGFGGGRGGFGGGFGGRGGYGGGGYAGGNAGAGAAGAGPYDANAASNPPNPFTDFATSGGEPSTTIYVRNLPWSTSNEDLIELFSTIGTVKRAEIQYEPNGRSRGTGVVEFEKGPDAETSIRKLHVRITRQRLTCNREVHRLPVWWQAARSDLGPLHQPEQRRCHGGHRGHWLDPGSDHVEVSGEASSRVTRCGSFISGACDSMFMDAGNCARELSIHLSARAKCISMLILRLWRYRG